jgi:hypothetical protein
VGFVVDKVALGQVFSKYFGSPANSHSTDYSTLIIYHPGLVQAKQWPTYQVDSVSPHPKKLKKKNPQPTSVGTGECYLKLFISTKI